MECELMSLPVVQLARCLLMVKRIVPVRLSDNPSRWALLIEGRGFTRLLRDDPMPRPMLNQSYGPRLPAPRTFHSRVLAVSYAQGVAIMPRPAAWKVMMPPRTP
jgi:hypothetical protein